MEGLDSLLEAAKKQSAADFGNVTRQIEECGILTTLENLQTNPDEQVYEIAFKILENYFATEEEGEAANP